MAHPQQGLSPPWVVQFGGSGPAPAKVGILGSPVLDPRLLPQQTRAVYGHPLERPSWGRREQAGPGVSASLPAGRGWALCFSKGCVSEGCTCVAAGLFWRRAVEGGRSRYTVAVLNVVGVESSKGCRRLRFRWLRSWRGDVRAERPCRAWRASLRRNEGNCGANVDDVCHSAIAAQPLPLRLLFWVFVCSLPSRCSFLAHLPKLRDQPSTSELLLPIN